LDLVLATIFYLQLQMMSLVFMTLEANLITTSSVQVFPQVYLVQQTSIIPLMAISVMKMQVSI